MSDAVLLNNGVSTAVFVGTPDAAAAAVALAAATAEAVAAGASATAAAASAVTAANNAALAPLALDKAGGARVFSTATIGSIVAIGTGGSISGARGIVWINPTSAPSVYCHLASVTIPVSVVGDGTLTLAIVSLSGTTATVQQVVALTGLTSGSNVVPLTNVDMQPGWRLGWWSATGGAQVNGLATGASVNFYTTASAPTQGQTFTVGTSAGQQYPIQGSIQYEPTSNALRIAGIEADFTNSVTFGATNGGTGNSGVATYTPNNTVAELAYFDTLAVVVDAAGTGLLEVLVPDSLGVYTVSAQYPIAIPAGGLNTLKVGSPAMKTACPYLPAVFPVAPGTRIAFKALTLNVKYQSGSGASQVTGDTALGSTVTIAASQDVSVAVTFRTRRTDQITPAARDEVVQATATVSGSNVIVAGVLNRNGSPVQFSGTVALASVGTGSVANEAQTINTLVLTGILAHANVSNVVVTRVSDSVVLTEGTHYTVNYENGVVQAVSGSTAVTISYNYSNRRYDAIYLNPETLAVGIVAGSERVRDASEWIPAVPTSAPACIRLFNARLTSTTTDLVATWEFFLGQRKQLSRQMFDNHRRSRATTRKTLGRLRSGKYLNVGVVGDSIAAIQNAVPTQLYNGVERDRATDAAGYLITAIKADTIAGIPSYDFADGAGTVHTKFGQIWTALQEIADAYGYAINVPQTVGGHTVAASTADYTINFFNYAIAGTSSSSGIPNVSAQGLHLCFVHYGMNELPISAGQQNTTETQIGTFVAARVAAGTDVVVIGTERPNYTYAGPLMAAGWPMVNRALRRAAETNGAAFINAAAIYDDANLGAIGIVAKETCQVNFYVHPGIVEHAAMGRLVAAPFVDE